MIFPKHNANCCSLTLLKLFCGLCVMHSNWRASRSLRPPPLNTSLASSLNSQSALHPLPPHKHMQLFCSTRAAPPVRWTKLGDSNQHNFPLYLHFLHKKWWVLPTASVRPLIYKAEIIPFTANSSLQRLQWIHWGFYNFHFLKVGK